MIIKYKWNKKNISVGIIMFDWGWKKLFLFVWGTAFALFVFLLLIVVMQSRNTLLLQQKLPIGKSHAL